MVYAISRGPMLVDTVNDPFGGNGLDLAERVATAMSYQVPTLPFAFTANSGRAIHPQIRVVLAFDAPPVSGFELCGGTRKAPVRPPNSGRIDAVAAFCDGAESLSEVHGWTEVTGLGDPRLQALLGEMTLNLFGDNTEMKKGHSASTTSD